MNRRLTHLAMLGLALAAGASASAVATAAPGEIPPAWVGRYQAQVISATSGKEGDAVSSFGKGMTQTTLMLHEKFPEGWDYGACALTWARECFARNQSAMFPAEPLVNANVPLTISNVDPRAN